MRHFSRLACGDGGDRRPHQWAEHRNVVAWRVNDDHRERNAGEILLIFEIAIDR